MTDLFTAVRQWGQDKGIVFEGNETRQMLKTIEEAGELAAALTRGDRVAAADAYGDIIVTVIVGSACLGLRAEQCLEDALNVITKRKGQLLDGVFVKDGE
jgi:NTP pyrophosphatase (non-canonical NTP hydrolase)